MAPKPSDTIWGAPSKYPFLSPSADLLNPNIREQAQEFGYLTSSHVTDGQPGLVASAGRHLLVSPNSEVAGLRPISAMKTGDGARRTPCGTGGEERAPEGSDDPEDDAGTESSVQDNGGR